MNVISVWSKGEIILTEEHWSTRRKTCPIATLIHQKSPLNWPLIESGPEPRETGEEPQDLKYIFVGKLYYLPFTNEDDIFKRLHLFCEMYSLRTATLNSRNMSQ